MYKSKAYLRAMAEKGAEAQKLKAANAAFGSQSARLMALYGPSNRDFIPEIKSKKEKRDRS